MTLNGVMALFCVISTNSGSFRAHCVNVHVRYSSPDEFLLLLLVKCSLIWSKMPALQDKEERSGLSELVTFVGAANCVN